MTKVFSGSFAFAVSQALSNQIDLRDFTAAVVRIPPSTDLVAGTLFRPEVSHTTEATDFAALLTSTGGTATLTPSTGGITRWQLFDKDSRHAWAAYARLHSVNSTGGDVVSTGTYSIPVMSKY